MAQGFAGGLTAWALLLHLTRLPHVSPFFVAFAGLALVLSLRKTDDLRGRAAACFTGALLLASLLASFALTTLIQLILAGVWPGGIHLLTEDGLILVAAVLLSVAGAFFWLASKSSGDAGA